MLPADPLTFGAMGQTQQLCRPLFVHDNCLVARIVPRINSGAEKRIMVFEAGWKIISKLEVHKRSGKCSPGRSFKASCQCLRNATKISSYSGEGGGRSVSDTNTIQPPPIDFITKIKSVSYSVCFKTQFLIKQCLGTIQLTRTSGYSDDY